MKRVIRKGVFETNSSSTHSFTILTETEKNIRKKMHDKKLEECHEKANKMEDVEKAKFFVYKEEDILQREYIECYPSRIEQQPMGKIFWLSGVLEDSYQKEYFIEWDPVPDNEMKEILIDRLKYILNGKLNPKANEELIKVIEVCADYDVELLLLKLWEFDPEFDQIVEQNPVLREISFYYVLLKFEAESMYDALIDEYCKLNNVSKEDADKKFSKKGHNKLFYENKINKWAEKFYKIDKKFKDFIDRSNCLNMVEAFKNYITFAMEEKNKNCNKKAEIEQYFGNGYIDDCNRDYCDLVSNYLSIIGVKNKISKDKNKNLSYAEFAEEFLSNKYTVYWSDGWSGINFF